MLEFLNNLWLLGTEKEKGCRTGPQATCAGRIDSLESILGLLKSFDIRAQKNQTRKKEPCQGQRTVETGYQKKVSKYHYLAVCKSADEAKMGGGMMRWEYNCVCATV